MVLQISLVYSSSNSHESYNVAASIKYTQASLSKTQPNASKQHNGRHSDSTRRAS